MERLKNMQGHPLFYYLKSIAINAFVKKYRTGDPGGIRTMIMTTGPFLFRYSGRAVPSTSSKSFLKKCTLPLSARDGQADNV